MVSSTVRKAIWQKPRFGTYFGLHFLFGFGFRYRRHEPMMARWARESSPKKIDLYDYPTAISLDRQGGAGYHGS